jgi:uncharacterized oxidoreductase
LKDTPVEVVELIPTYVQTTLTGAHQAGDPNAMPLNDYIEEVIEMLKSNPQATEVNVKRVLPLRQSAEQGQAKYEVFFKEFNGRFA